MTMPTRLVVRRTSGGRALLLMDNYLYNRGPGRVQFRGHRSERYRMDAVQLVDRSGGRAPIPVQTGAKLTWKYVDSRRGTFWKFQNAARFELWRLNAEGRRVRLLRFGPKLDYCLRDLFRFGRGATVRRGPYTYPQNWVDVTGLRGCHVIIHRADPLNHVLETNEDDNTNHKVVRLPYRP